MSGRNDLLGDSTQLIMVVESSVWVTLYVCTLTIKFLLSFTLTSDQIFLSLHDRVSLVLSKMTE